jgi:hypothetical protein
MRRDALRRFLREVALAAPLLVGGCVECHETPGLSEVQDPKMGSIITTQDGGPCDPIWSCAIQQPCHVPDQCQEVQTDLGVKVLCHYPGLPCPHDCTGRRPAGLRAIADSPTENALGAWLARSAHLEAASVIAFDRLERELASFGAPRSLRARARCAARDEIRHAKIMKRLARCHGSSPAPVEISPIGERSLEAIAVENAIEGCVIETFGAGIAVWQARHASDPAIARAMRTIAPDEESHAALSADVAAWASQELSPEANQRVRVARDQAIHRLAHSLDGDSLEMSRAAGLPLPRSARALFRLAARTVWA